MTTVWIYTSKRVLDEETRKRLEKALPAPVFARRTRVGSSDRDASLLAYTALIRLAEKRWPGVSQKLCFTDRGKPCFYVKNAPYCSISHTGGAMAVALSDRPVGVDVQAVTRIREAVVSRVFTAKERAAIAFAAPGEGERLFTRIWAQKEAALKKSGLGLYGLRQIPPEPGVYTLMEADGWVAAVCAEETAVIVVDPVSTLL